jgi:uncharacterized protein (DUF58 family)
MNIKEIEKAVGALQGSIFKKSSSLSGGVLKSHLRGSGLQFKEHQVYNPGDDVRFIDWKLTARTNNVYIKTFEEDRNVEIVVIVDVTQSMFYGSNSISKFQMSLELTALLYLVAKESQDNVKVIILLDEKIELPSKRGREGLVMLMAELEKRGLLDEKGRVLNIMKHENKLSVKDKMALIKASLGKRKEVIYIGDLFSFEGIIPFDKILNERRFHSIQTLSPIDTTSLKFSIPAKGQRAIPGVGLAHPKELRKYPRVLSLYTNEKYLDIFVRKFK